MKPSDLLSQPGAWTREDASCGGYTLLRAIYVCANEIREYGEWCEKIIKYLHGGRGSGPTRNLTIWNDAPGRTQAEVVALLREVGL